MRSRTAIALVSAALALLPAVALAERERGATTHEASSTRVAEDRLLLVTFADRPDAATAGARLAGLGAVRESAPEIGIWELAAADPATARAAALARPGVARAEWSLVRTADVLTDPRPLPPPALPLIASPEPVDPLFAQPSPNQQWGLRLGTWSLGLSAYDRPIIAILDSGLDTTHEEWSQPGLVVAPRSTLRNVDRADDVAVTGHGTHVAGIAAAPANGIGIVGVAPASAASPTPGVSRVLPVQIADALGRSTDATMIRGIVWAVNNGAKVINISSGGPGASNAFQDTVNWAFKRGALITASVGNEGLDDNPVNFPAGYDHVIGVGAQCDGIVVPRDCPLAFARARFSNFNYSVDVLAPGVNIPSTVPLTVASRPIAPGYAFKDGTSMAAPYVAGVVALIYASHPGITPYQVTRILQQTSSRGAVGRTSSDGWGTVNPLQAVQAQAPVDDLSEPNDDVKWLPKRDSLRATRTVKRLNAWIDFNDDQFDVYPVVLLKGERMRVTVSAPRAGIGLQVFRPSTTSVSFRTRSADYLASKSLGRTRFLTPGSRSLVVRATESGRHFILLEAQRGRGGYSVSIQRL